MVNVCLRVDVSVSFGKLPLSRYSCGTISFWGDKAIISALDTKITSVALTEIAALDALLYGDISFRDAERWW